MFQAALRTRFIALALLMFASILGCRSYGTKGSGTNSVSGTVNIAGVPLEKGTINLRWTTDGKGIAPGPGGAAIIANGAFEIKNIQAGKYLVAITSTFEDFEQPLNAVDVVDGPNPPLNLDLPKRGQGKKK